MTENQAQQAQETILHEAPACIARLTVGTPNRHTAESLLGTAHRGSVTELAPAQQQRLATYAATMHRDRPHPRTIVGLLRLLQKT